MQPPSPTAILQVSGLYFSHPGRELFANFTATFAPGITLVCGGDGRGKSTLLRLLAGTLAPQAGHLSVHGINAQAQPANYAAQLFRAEPGSDAFDQISATEYLTLQRSRHPNFDNVALADITTGLGLQDHLHKQLFMLSTGSKRKVFLAAALASNAAVTLLDEPFAALDAASIGFMLRWLKNTAVTGNRAWVVADYAPPADMPLLQMIELGD